MGCRRWWPTQYHTPARGNGEAHGLSHAGALAANCSVVLMAVRIRQHNVYGSRQTALVIGWLGRHQVRYCQAIRASCNTTGRIRRPPCRVTPTSRLPVSVTPSCWLGSPSSGFGVGYFVEYNRQWQSHAKWGRVNNKARRFGQRRINNTAVPCGKCVIWVTWESPAFAHRSPTGVVHRLPSSRLVNGSSIVTMLGVLRIKHRTRGK